MHIGLIGRTFADEYVKYDTTGIKSDKLKELISTYQMPIEARYLEIDEIAAPRQVFLISLFLSQQINN